MELGTLWSAAGVIAGFQITAFTWRITREVNLPERPGRADAGRRGDPGAGNVMWLPLADLLNLVSLAVTLLGVFVGTALGLVGLHGATLAFAWAVLLLAAWPLAVAGHYNLFDEPWKRLKSREPREGRPYATRQEIAVVALAAVASLAFWLIAGLQ